MLVERMVIEEKRSVNLYRKGAGKGGNLHGAKQVPPAPATRIQVDIPREK